MRLKVRAHMLKHYSTYMLVTNAMIGVATAAFAILGCLTAYVSVPVLIGNAVVFGLIMGIGRFANEELEDMSLVIKVEASLE